MNEVDPLVRKFQKELSAGTVSFLLLRSWPKPKRRYMATRLPNSWNRTAMACYPASKAPCIRCCAISDAAGLLQSEVEPSVAGPPRRYYRITDFGREVFSAWRNTWQQTQTLVNTVLEGAPQ